MYLQVLIVDELIVLCTAIGAQIPALGIDESDRFAHHVGNRWECSQ